MQILVSRFIHQFVGLSGYKITHAPPMLHLHPHEYKGIVYKVMTILSLFQWDDGYSAASSGPFY